MHPVDIIWRADGSSEPDTDIEPTTGRCAFTLTQGEVWPLRRFVSANFNSKFQADQTGDMVSAAAIWALTVWGPVRGKKSRLKDSTIAGLLVHSDGYETLSVGCDLPPLDERAAVVVPITRQTHSVAQAAWGAWTTEAGAVHITPRHHQALTRLADLRVAGLGEAEAREATPRVSLISKLDMPLPDLLSAWDELRTLQQIPALAEMGIRITRQPKEKQ